MQVRIVEKKDDVKEMTVEELAACQYIGLQTRRGRRILATYSDVLWGFLSVPDDWCAASETKLIAIQKEAANKFHVFETAQELYKWMAE